MLGNEVTTLCIIQNGRTSDWYLLQFITLQTPDIGSYIKSEVVSSIEAQQRKASNACEAIDMHSK